MFLSNKTPHTLRDLLELRAQRYQEKTFLFFREATVSYHLLDRVTNSVGNGLGDLGVHKGENVCLLLPNSPEFLYAFFGVMKMGGVAVPLNINLKGEEIQYILHNSEAVSLITTPAFLETVRQIRPLCPRLRYIIVTGDKTSEDTILFSDLCSASDSPLEIPLDETDLAAIIYTSGTTGRPKGVILTHLNYLFDTEQLVAVTHLTEQDRILCILPLFHVNGQVVTTLAPLYAGASMILMERFTPKEFFPTLSKFKATAFSGVPTVYAILLNLPEADQYDLRSLRFCVCGAAPMPVELFEKFEQKFRAYILEGYGLSEGTCVSSVNPVGGTRKIGSIGIPIPGQEMKIVDQDERELPPGQVGEIVIKGENVMVGYYKNPEATAEAIKQGWLHTGDLGYMDSDGYFFIVGRKKEMIIRGGENIYPKEVEEVLYRHPQILEAAVVGLPDPVWGEEVAAFIVPREGEILSESEIITFCKRSLADFKCPRRVFFVKDLPTTATGKIQKSRIREEYLKKTKGEGKG